MTSRPGSQQRPLPGVVGAGDDGPSDKATVAQYIRHGLRPQARLAGTAPRGNAGSEVEGVDVGAGTRSSKRPRSAALRVSSVMLRLLRL